MVAGHRTNHHDPWALDSNVRICSALPSALHVVLDLLGTWKMERPTHWRFSYNIHVGQVCPLCQRFSHCWCCYTSTTHTLEAIDIGNSNTLLHPLLALHHFNALHSRVSLINCDCATPHPSRWFLWPRKPRVGNACWYDDRSWPRPVTGRSKSEIQLGIRVAVDSVIVQCVRFRGGHHHGCLLFHSHWPQVVAPWDDRGERVQALAGRQARRRGVRFRSLHLQA